MTDEVAALCLRNNYLQSLALSVEEQRGLAAFPEHLALIEALEKRGELNRAVEFLADDAALPPARAGRPGPHPARTRGAARLRQERRQCRPAADRRPRRSLSRPRTLPLFPQPADRDLRRHRHPPSAAPRGDRHGALQRHDQSRRSGLRQRTDVRDQRRCRPGRRRLRRRPRCLWPARPQPRHRRPRWRSPRQDPADALRRRSRAS